MKLTLSLIAAGSMIAIAAPAAAQEEDNFSGFHIEGLAGYDSSRPGSTVDIDNPDDVNQSIHDVTYGGGVGYDMKSGNMVFGIEGEWMESNAKTDYDTTGFTGFGVSHVETGRDLYVGARIGVLATPNILLYVKGGYTNAKFNVLATDNVTDVQTDANLDGWRAGGGIEVALSKNFFIKGEYRYSNYTKGTFEAPSGLESDRFNVDLDRHQGVVGVGMRF